MEPQGPEEDCRSPGRGEEVLDTINGGHRGNIVPLTGGLVFLKMGESTCVCVCACVCACACACTCVRACVCMCVGV